MSSSALYEIDFYAWTRQQSQFLKAGLLNEIDIHHLIEELDDVGKSERRALESHLRNLLLHLLKWQFQPQLRGSSWRQSIRNARIAVDKIVKDSPSLKSLIIIAIQDEYANAKADAVDETGLNEAYFPSVCPYSEADLLNKDFWPN